MTALQAKICPEETLLREIKRISDMVVYVPIQDATRNSLFEAIGKPLDSLVFTADEIADFIKEYPEFFPEGGITFFLYKNKKKNLVVQRVSKLENKLFFFTDSLKLKHVVLANYLPKIIVKAV